MPLAIRPTCALRYAVLAAFLAVLLIALSGAVSARADSINILAPYWLAVAIAGLPLLGLTSRSKPVRWGAFALLTGFLCLGALLLAPLGLAATSASEGQRIRVVSFNMRKDNAAPERAVRWLRDQDADFLILLEVSAANEPVLAGLRSTYPFVYQCSRKGRCSTRIFSRIAAQDVWPLAYGDADNRKALSAITARFRLDGRMVPVTAIHLSRPWPLGHQRTELPALADALATFGRGGVVAGDFNSAPWTFAVRRLADAGEVALASGASGTWPARATSRLLRLPLDQLYVGSCLSPIAVSRGPALGSDHLPLVADLSLGACRG